MMRDNRSSTMNTTKTLILAGLAALSLGVGSAMAQEGPSMIGGNDYWTLHQSALDNRQAHAALAQGAGQIQSGGSDADTGHFNWESGWVGDNSPYRFDYGTLNSPG
jgi:hypothetical protein